MVFLRIEPSVLREGSAEAADPPSKKFQRNSLLALRTEIPAQVRKSRINYPAYHSEPSGHHPDGFEDQI